MLLGGSRYDSITVYICCISCRVKTVGEADLRLSAQRTHTPQHDVLAPSISLVVRDLTLTFVYFLMFQLHINPQAIHNSLFSFDLLQHAHR